MGPWPCQHTKMWTWEDVNLWRYEHLKMSTCFPSMPPWSVGRHCTVDQHTPWYVKGYSLPVLMYLKTSGKGKIWHIITCSLFQNARWSYLSEGIFILENAAVQSLSCDSRSLLNNLRLLVGLLVGIQWVSSCNVVSITV